MRVLCSGQGRKAFELLCGFLSDEEMYLDYCKDGLSLFQKVIYEVQHPEVIILDYALYKGFSDLIFNLLASKNLKIPVILLGEKVHGVEQRISSWISENEFQFDLQSLHEKVPLFKKISLALENEELKSLLYAPPAVKSDFTKNQSVSSGDNLLIKSTKENLEYNFGMPQPQGYRKALRLFKHANKFNMPIITLIDTPGAYPGIRAEETGQGSAIAVNLREMSKLDVPVISIITGEGCSGGALGLAVANRVMMLEHAYYTVISPEGCASILWRDAAMYAEAAEALKITSKDLLQLGVIDTEIKEPVGGAHTDYEKTAKNIKSAISKALGELKNLSAIELKEERYNKFRAMGKFIEI